MLSFSNSYHRLRVYIDRDDGTAALYDADGTLLAEEEIAELRRRGLPCKTNLQICVSMSRRLGTRAAEWEQEC